ncbi:MAG: malonyl-CoA decarboxylase [Pseudomonadota bacterium]
MEKPGSTSFFSEFMNSVAEQGWALLPRALRGARRDEELDELIAALVSSRGEASGVAIARAILSHYQTMDAAERLRFFSTLNEQLMPDKERVTRAATRYIADPSPQALSALQQVVDSPRQEFFRRLNLARGATAALVKMREDLLSLLRAHPELQPVDNDLKHLLMSWFNRGFLELRHIDWQTPAAILEKIIAYEAVHEIAGWDDLRRRLEPSDRRCFAYFHPSLTDEPLIFVEVALLQSAPAAIHDVLREPPNGEREGGAPTTAVFYSISNCQKGLRGISFGNFLIKHVVEDLLKEQPQLKTFITLSPVPGFTAWLQRVLDSEGVDDGRVVLDDQARAQVASLIGHRAGNDATPDISAITADDDAGLRSLVLSLAAHYFLHAKSSQGGPFDPVARFHLGNGARLERINWRGDLSPKAMRGALGLMVNYLYERRQIEVNHEAFVNEGKIAAARTVRSLLRVGGAKASSPAQKRAPAQAALPPPRKATV